MRSSNSTTTTTTTSHVQSHRSSSNNTSQPSSPTADRRERYHTRRKSGKEYVVTERKGLVRPAPLVRRSTASQYVTKTPSGRRDKDRDDRDEDRALKTEQGESFPQYCMTCEKQFFPANNTVLYCSEACRLHDRSASQSRSNSYSTASATTSTPTSPVFTAIAFNTPLYEDGPDILPRFSPTQSRPHSYYASSNGYADPFTVEDSSSGLRALTSTGSRSSTALASLRELATALPRASTKTEPSTPPDASISSLSRAWSYMPFTSKHSMSKGSYATSSRSRTGSREDLAGHTAYGGTTLGMYAGAQGMERPLPPRSGPSGYAHRPRSVDLVTPYVVGV